MTHSATLNPLRFDILHIEKSSWWMAAIWNKKNSVLLHYLEMSST